MRRKTEIEATPFAKMDSNDKPFQFGLGTLLLIMVVFSIASTALFWASQLPRISEEIHAWLGTVPSVNDDGTSRDIQLGLLLFCYSSPLLMAGLLNLTVMFFRWIDRAQQRKTVEDDEFSMESSS